MSKALQVNRIRPDFGFDHVVDNIFNNSMRRFFDGNLWDADSSTNRGTAPVNIREKEDQYEVDLIAPGCRKEDFDIQVKEGQLLISFNHQEEKKNNSENAGWVRNEYIMQSFSRSFTLDNTVDIEKIKAHYTDGILKVVLPKNEKAKPVSIAIDVK